MDKIKAVDIEIAVAQLFNPRVNLIVPNVHWGFDVHECDLLIVSKSGYATEVEIKVSAADLKKDADKKHGHNSPKIKNLYFAIPEPLLQYEEFIPKRAGIIVVYDHLKTTHTSSYSSRNPVYVCRIHRSPESVGAYKLTEKEMFAIARLGTMRIWSLKNEMSGLKDIVDEYKNNEANRGKV